MPKISAVLLLVFFVFLGCAMLGSWRTIPPPGGCDQCHEKEISSDWTVAYAAATIQSETGQEAWQQQESVLPFQPSPLEQQKITDQQCFRCHKSPNRAHKEYHGRYHHKALF